MNNCFVKWCYYVKFLVNQKNNSLFNNKKKERIKSYADCLCFIRLVFVYRSSQKNELKQKFCALQETISRYNKLSPFFVNLRKIFDENFFYVFAHLYGFFLCSLARAILITFY
jgi:hypothetical protein